MAAVTAREVARGHLGAGVSVRVGDLEVVLPSQGRPLDGADLAYLHTTFADVDQVLGLLDLGFLR